MEIQIKELKNEIQALQSEHANTLSMKEKEVNRSKAKIEQVQKEKEEQVPYLLSLETQQTVKSLDIYIYRRRKWPN